MSRRQAAMLAAAALALAAGLALKNHFSEEAVIRRLFATVATAIEQESILTVASNVARRYSDPRGLTYESFLGAVNDLMTSYDDLTVPHGISQISITGTTASADLTFRVYGNGTEGSGQIFGTTLEPIRARVILREERGGWKIESIEEIEGPGIP